MSFSDRSVGLAEAVKGSEINVKREPREKIVGPKLLRAVGIALKLFEIIDTMLISPDFCFYVKSVT